MYEYEYDKMGAHGTNDNVAIEICSDVDLTSCCKWSLLFQFCYSFSSFHFKINICLLLVTSVFIMKCTYIWNTMQHRYDYQIGYLSKDTENKQILLYLTIATIYFSCQFWSELGLLIQYYQMTGVAETRYIFKKISIFIMNISISLKEPYKLPQSVAR